VTRAALIEHTIERNCSLLHTGDASIGAEIRALVERPLSDRPGDWRVSIVGPREWGGWEMKVWGPNGCWRRRCRRAERDGENRKRLP
jgi:hypothetical protein